MKRLMTVLDVFNSPKTGLIVTGRNDDLDSFEVDDIIRLIGDKILIAFLGGGGVELSDFDVDIGVSVLDKKNISIRINEGLVDPDMMIDSEVYCL